MSANGEGDHGSNVSHDFSGMTPSIITTINNTSPILPSEHNANHNNTYATNKSKIRPSEPYESYIEDSFVGHWEREDDDDDDPNNKHIGNKGGGTAHETDGDESDMHPSTIEFDFDSFGPESFIYTPANTATWTTAAAAAAAASAPTTTTTTSTTDETTPSESATILPDVREGETRVEKLGTPVQIQDLAKDTVESTSKSMNQAERPSAVTNLEATKKSTPTPNESPHARALITNPLDEYLVDPAKIDLKVIEPYKKVISHAGYCHHFDPSAPAPTPGEPAPAIIVFSACYLPDRSRRDYNYVMDHLFLYVLSSLHELIADDYILIYLHNTQPSTTAALRISSGASSSNGGLADGSTSPSTSPEESRPQNNLPTFSWMKRCYQMIDRKLRKNLKILYLVKPTFWLKTIFIMCKPFISAKFSKKLRFVEDMAGLRKCLPVDKLILPASAQNI